MDWVKEILSKYVSDDQIAEAVKTFNEELPKQFIPKGRFNEVSDEAKLLKQQLDDNKKAFEEVSRKASTVEEYEKRIADMTVKNKETEESYQKNIVQISKKTALKDLLMANNVHKDAIDLLVEKYADTAEYATDKGLRDSDKLLAKIREEKAGLFIVTTEESQDKDAKKALPEKNPELARIRGYMGLK